MVFEHEDQHDSQWAAIRSVAEKILRVWNATLQVYGVRKISRQLTREGIRVARCSVARLMREMGLQGAVRGRRFKTTIADDAAARSADLVNRTF